MVNLWCRLLHESGFGCMYTRVELTSLPVRYLSVPPAACRLSNISSRLSIAQFMSVDDLSLSLADLCGAFLQFWIMVTHFYSFYSLSCHLRLYEYENCCSVKPDNCLASLNVAIKPHMPCATGRESLKIEHPTLGCFFSQAGTDVDALRGFALQSMNLHLAHSELLVFEHEKNKNELPEIRRCVPLLERQRLTGTRSRLSRLRLTPGASSICQFIASITPGAS